ncbi:MAG: response regulator [Acidaminobacter sp.]|uniref:response regulator transcription factor n=1 Tax=Acidaminobacter sp. TaxID=1872102 RepID=UPI00137D42BB|nr:response regulator transcription factor [Acidaminobacter sp.]MZQ97141.1 response regulator [Acidaminobacter sp.]
MIQVVVVDDQTLLAEGLKMLLSKEPDIEVVAVGANGLEAIQLVANFQPEVLLLDIRMPEMDGVEAIRRLRAQGENVKIIILTTFNDDQYIHEGMALGAQGYLLKDATPAQIGEAIRAVAGGSSVMAPGVAERVFKKTAAVETEPSLPMAEAPQDSNLSGRSLPECFRDLTEREKDIVALVAEGKSNLEISETLYLTEGTVKNHLTKILGKCCLRDRTQLAVLWIRGSLE